MGKYILQYGNLAGWPFRIAKGLRDAGYNSINVIADEQDYKDLDRRLPHDRAISSKKASRYRKFIERSFFMLEAADSASLVHYHAAVIQRAKWHSLFEGPLFRKREIPMILSFAGSDARIISEARARNPYFHLELDEKSDAKVRQYLSQISKCIRYVATDYEMAQYIRPYFERCFIFRQPIDLNVIKFNPPILDRPPIILHVPTDTKAKGTDYVIAAVEELRRQGYKFEFRLRRQLTQTQLYQEIAACDIYVDELRCGAHGMTAVETMAAGKPTLTYIKPDLVSEYPADMPLVNANPDTIYNQLRALICDADRRAAISYAGRNYVEKYHDLKIVVQDLLEIYKTIGWS